MNVHRGVHGGRVRRKTNEEKVTHVDVLPIFMMHSDCILLIKIEPGSIRTGSIRTLLSE